MWLWSKGLGRLILPMELGEAEVQLEGDTVVVKGRVVAPKIRWDYTLAMGEEDLLDFMRVLTDRRVVEYLMREGGLEFLGIIVGRAPRFGLAYLSAELRKLVKRGER
ncbi:MAG: hypothetical protein ACE5LU_14005 [Anaerolineae bacterium]